MPVPAQEAPSGGDNTVWHCRLAAGALAAAAVAAYANSFSGPFVYDDRGSVVDNPTIRHLLSSLRPSPSGWPVNGRPVFNFSLALNYAVSGLGTTSYHLLSLLIHLCAGLALFGIVRRTLAAMDFSPSRALLAGWASALLWTLHPLQTESVTYISQRSESLMGLFYLLTLYCFIRFSDETLTRSAPGTIERNETHVRIERHETLTRSAPGTIEHNETHVPIERNEMLARIERSGTRKRFVNTWAAGSIVFCLLGMATKEVMVTAPLMVLLYDRVFVARGWKGVGERKAYYMTLAATWVVLALLLARSGNRGGTVGFGSSVPWWGYGLTQVRAVARYLELCLWPRPLLFSYGLVLGGPTWEIAVDALVILALALTSVIAAFRGSRLGYLGAWFFLILSPTSTVVPVATELIAEHRVYLSLAAVTSLLAWLALRWNALTPARFIAALLAIAAALAVATHHRNRVYASVAALWADTVAKSPDDAGARNNLGNALAEEGRPQEAMEQFEAALRLVPGYDDPHFNLGNVLLKLGRAGEAIPHYRAALRVQPDNARIRYALGMALRESGQPAEARREFERALAGTSDLPVVWYDLGNALLDEGQLGEAEKALAQAIRLRPDYADALVNHAGILARLDRPQAAIAEFQAALRLEPNAADVHNTFGALLAESGRLADARREFETALALKPDYREARDNLLRIKAMELAAPQ